MKTLARVASALTLALLALPQTVSAAYSIYTDSAGNFSFAFGKGATGAFACAGNNICQVASTILYIINFVLVPVLFAIAFIVFLWGVFKTYIWSRGDETAVTQGHKLIFWGVIGFVVMISLWGLVNVVANTFGLAGYGAPRPPSSQYPGY